LPAWVYDTTTSRGIGRQAAELIPVIPGFFTERLRLIVEDSLIRTADLRRTVSSPDGTQVLSQSQISSLIKVIATRFSRADLDLLVQDLFDESLDNISDPAAPQQQRAIALILHAQRHGLLPQLIDRLADSHRDDGDLRRLSAKRQRR
jgi:hypothetical protein